jgi:DeoR/GlpR family transcriptional regulator of sugar metabolism
MSTIKQRHKAIIQLLRQEGGQLSVNTLSARLGVSAVTIRQDLRALAGDNMLERVFGGAVLRSPAPLSGELAFEVRLREARQAKDAIGRFAAQLVKDGYGIALDGSTTSYALVPYLKTCVNLTIVTNSLIIAQSFRDNPRNKVLVPAGRVRGESATIVSQTESLPDLNLSYGFFGAWGLSTESGATDVDLDEVDMRKAMMTRCRQVVIVIDGRKWGEIAPYTFAAPDQIHRVITDDSAPDDLVDSLRARGIGVSVAQA